jgi:hypothetical protein
VHSAVSAVSESEIAVAGQQQRLMSALAFEVLRLLRSTRLLRSALLLAAATSHYIDVRSLGIDVAMYKRIGDNFTSQSTCALYASDSSSARGTLSLSISKSVSSSCLLACGSSSS